MPRKHLFIFVGKVVLWLPVMFALWYYYFSSLISGLVAWLLEFALVGLFPEIFHELKPLGYSLEVVTHLVLQPSSSLSIPEGSRAVIAFDVNPLLYGFGLPFYAALLMALPDNREVHSGHFLGGFILLVLVQAIGINFDIWKALIFQFGNALDKRLTIASYVPELVAYGYQMSSLILPVVTPAILWLGFFQDYWQNLGQEDEFI